MVGDPNIDIEAGEKVGCKSFLLHKPTFLGRKAIIFSTLGDLINYVLSCYKIIMKLILTPEGDGARARIW